MTGFYEKLQCRHLAADKLIPGSAADKINQMAAILILRKPGAYRFKYHP